MNRFRYPKVIKSLFVSQFKDKQKQKVYAKSFPNMEHMAILKEDDSIAHVMQVLHNITQKNEKAVATAAAGAKSSLRNKNLFLNIIQENKTVSPSAAHSALRTEEAIHAAAAAAAEAVLSNDEAMHAAATAAKALLKTENALHAAAAAAKAALRKGDVDAMNAPMHEQTPETTDMEAWEKAREKNMVMQYWVPHYQDENRIKRSSVDSSAIWKILNNNPNVL